MLIITLFAPHATACKGLLFLICWSEVPGFLSEEECRVVVQLAQLKGLMESQMTAPSWGQGEPDHPLLSLTTEEVFSLLDLNQDGLLQKQEVTIEKQFLAIYIQWEYGRKLLSS